MELSSQEAKLVERSRLITATTGRTVFAVAIGVGCTAFLLWSLASADALAYWIVPIFFGVSYVWERWNLGAELAAASGDASRKKALALALMGRARFRAAAGAGASGLPHRPAPEGDDDVARACGLLEEVPIPDYRKSLLKRLNKISKSLREESREQDGRR